MIFRQPFKNDWPITQNYGEKITSDFHTGIDYACPLNTPILASADGMVMFAGWDPTGYGNTVILRHSDDRATLYAHLGSIYVKVGENARQGSLLGHSGTSGNSTGPHLHFEARKQWNYYKSHFDPMLLPLTTVDDSVKLQKSEESLKPGMVKIIAPSGVWAHTPSFTEKTALPFGAVLNFTGKTTECNGLTFCECTLWLADNDGETDLLSNI